MTEVETVCRPYEMRRHEHRDLLEVSQDDFPILVSRDRGLVEDGYPSLCMEFLRVVRSSVSSRPEI